MEAVIKQSSVRGTARAPPSKSYTHRAILAAGFSDGAMVTNPLKSADTRATARAVRAFGGDAKWQDNTIAVWGFDGKPAAPEEPIDCANSGTTMRLVTAVAALANGTTRLTGDESLRSRPQGPLLEAIEQLGGTAESEAGDGTAPLAITGPIDGGRVTIPGDVSSQYISALLMAGGATEDGISLSLETTLKSAPYVDVTLEVLENFGVRAHETPFGYAVDGRQSYRPPPGGYAVPCDFSSMSYLLAAGALAGEPQITVEDAVPSAQGDVAIVEILDRMGATVQWDRDRGFISVSQAELEGVEVSVADTPDLLPTIAAVGAAAGGETRITDCEHVRYKETDRVTAMAEELTTLGAAVTEHQDELVIHGSDSELVGGRVDGRGDHRIIMALTVAGLVAEGRTMIQGAEHVDVSFPNFFDVMRDIGVSAVEREQ